MLDNLSCHHPPGCNHALDCGLGLLCAVNHYDQYSIWLFNIQVHWHPLDICQCFSFTVSPLRRMSLSVGLVSSILQNDSKTL